MRRWPPFARPLRALARAHTHPSVRRSLARRRGSERCTHAGRQSERTFIVCCSGAISTSYLTSGYGGEYHWTGRWDWWYLNDVWSSADGGATWARLTAAAPWVARYQHATAAVGGAVVLTGGYGYVGYLNDVWSSADGGATWALLTAAALWVARSSHATSVVIPATAAPTSAPMARPPAPMRPPPPRQQRWARRAPGRRR